MASQRIRSRPEEGRKGGRMNSACRPGALHTAFNMLALSWIIISELLLSAHCLKDLKIFVPEAVLMGNAATLSCQYDLEQAALYAVRWYFGQEEFYRYVPREAKPTFVFAVAGINVDLANSDATSVTLKGVTRELSGSYQCEVSEDAPLFHTEIRSAYMQVIELPKDDPVLQVDKKVIGVNDYLKAVCTVGPSYPPANITWNINGNQIRRTPLQSISQDSYDGSTTHSALEIHANSQALQGFFETKYQHSVNLQCVVTIRHMYHKVVAQRIGLNAAPPTTISPNLLGLEGSKRYANGDPDNSALTGASQRCCICCGSFGAVSLAIFTLAMAHL
ncbi:uncharacterized protein LOC120453963 [Drosophila santomea]|uniref:uncharacterized protein LOC120453963 n=1 Tax=Drosophila santomea TaxID=129105 RepID=UPI0019545587|nr:uncharacterized protein LOC120453963 [Drosophila santomea]XP_039494848.1 uncharacterized protein LOC120453963 [Drosophila santomea]XP_039494849.1 uncharacterized protein LOC120453963 [Drosophila santomea]XP_039494850.1 uncharacterized protein LOC120453963 [Drosophila santomea]